MNTNIIIKVDSYACSGIDQLTEKVPQLKDATPKLIEETKVKYLGSLYIIFYIKEYFSELRDLLRDWVE